MLLSDKIKLGQIDQEKKAIYLYSGCSNQNTSNLEGERKDIYIPT